MSEKGEYDPVKDGEVRRTMARKEAILKKINTDEEKKQVEAVTDKQDNEIIKTINPPQLFDNEDVWIKRLEPIVAKTIVSLERKDYRATIINRQEGSQVPDAATAFIDIDPEKVNLFGYNRDLDVKGNVSNFQLFFNQSARFLSALAELKDWEYVERPDPDDDKKNIPIPIDMVALDAEEGRYLSMSLFGEQSKKEINLMRAVAGFPGDQVDKVTGFLGLTRRKKEDVYQDVP